jgi:hypothetical protein
MSKTTTATRRTIGPGLVAKTCDDPLVKRWLQKLARGDRPKTRRKNAKLLL